jgi:hypothetical protein
MTRYYLPVLLMACLGLLLSSACNDDKETGAVDEGIIFSPLAAYQEAYPGQIISFKLKVRGAGPVTSFAVRIKMPDGNEFAALPAYPDLEGEAAGFIADFRSFEYPLPASTDSIDQSVQFRFMATAGSKNYQADYTVRMRAAGLKNLRLYHPQFASYFNFNALDLVQERGVAADGPPETRDLVAVTGTVTNGLLNKQFEVLEGWQSANGTVFKQVTQATYDLPAVSYPGIFDSLPAAAELSGVSSLLTVPAGSTGPLAANAPYFIAKVSRGDAVHYIGLMVRKAPPVNFSNAGSLTALDSLNEYIQIEIRK